MLDHQKRIEDLERLLRGSRERKDAYHNDGLRDDQSIQNASNNGSVLGSHPPGQLRTGDLDLILSPMNGIDDGIANPQGQVQEPRIGISTSPAQPENGFTMDSVDLDTPMSTLRNLVSLTKEKESPPQDNLYNSAPAPLTREERVNFEQDPVAQGILTMEEAQHTFDIFFEHCHSMAPFMCTRKQRSAMSVRQSSPTLFLSVCTVGARFWRSGNSQLNSQGLHENYQLLVSLLDVAIARLLLQPKISDVNLDHIRCLLLYIQWMPVEQHTAEICQTRYNDISAWSVLGLAIRYSLFLGLDKTSVSPFTNSNINHPTEDDFARLRVWINLLTCDCHLMLSAGLPASLNPEPVAKIAREFAKHELAFQPDDSRIAAISELVAIIRKAASSSGDPSVRVLDNVTLRKANAEFDDWESFWAPALNHSLYSQMPFTSLRWYRLTLNSARLSSILSPSKKYEGCIQLPLLQALDISILSASQTICSLSAEATLAGWQKQSQQIATFPSLPFQIAQPALDRFRFAVDSSWITHSFAAVFLVLCYVRGAIDDELHILQLSSQPMSQLTVAPASPRPVSLFYRLISLASEIFDTICRTSATSHPAADYRTIIHNVFAVILNGKSDLDGTANVTAVDGIGDDMNVDALFELMFSNSAGFDWQSGLFRQDTGSDLQF